MSDLVASMRHEASEYEFDQYAATLLLKAADRIERLEAELAAANAKIRAAREIALQTWSDRLDFLHALGVESASPIRYSEAARGSEGAT